MKKLLAACALVVAFAACNNGNYNTNPNTTGGNTNNNNNNNNNNVTCPVLVADTACSCTDEVSWYANGVLHSGIGIAAHNQGNQGIEITGDALVYKISFGINNYTGTGTYNLSAADMNACVFTNEALTSFVVSGTCTGGKLVITEDDGTVVKGTFYAVAVNSVSNQYVAIKGGQFTATWY